MAELDESRPVNEPTEVGVVRRFVGSLVMGVGVFLFVLFLGVTGVGSIVGGLLTVAQGDWVPGLLLLVIGIGASGGAVIVLTSSWSRWRLVRTGIQTTGTLTAATRIDSGEGPFWVVDYTYSVDGAAMIGSVNRWAGPEGERSWEAGQRVVVVFDPKLPSKSDLL